MAERKPCGKHTELAANESARITRCGCGAVHLTLLTNGITVRLRDESLRNLTHALMSALDRVEEGEELPRIN